MKKSGVLVPNSTENIVGIFNNVEKAKNWIVKNGKSFFLTDKQMKSHKDNDQARMFAILAGGMNSDELRLVDFYDTTGFIVK